METTGAAQWAQQEADGSISTQELLSLLTHGSTFFCLDQLSVRDVALIELIQIIKEISEIHVYHRLAV